MNAPISYLEAVNLLKPGNLEKLKKKKICLFSSAEVNQLNIFIKGFYAKKGFDITIQTLDFGTLKQFLISNDRSLNFEQIIFILFPWDFVEALNWRTGFLFDIRQIEEYRQEIRLFQELISKKYSEAKFIYINSPVPEIFQDQTNNLIIYEDIKIAAHRLSSYFISEEYFSLSNFIRTGLPIKNKEIGRLAWLISQQAIKEDSSKKIIFLDLDNTLWKGVLGEDGPSGINAGQNDIGYFFFIFQTFLKYLKNNGILLVAVSKNDKDLIKNAFELNDFPLKESDFIKLIGTYEPKSIQIINLLKAINLTADSCIFIDDNKLEIQEVKNSNHEITCYLIENNLENLPEFLYNLKRNFEFNSITYEDQNRTDLYRKKLNNFEIEKGDYDNIDEYLISLDTRLSVKFGDRFNLERALQLINKTNQFNLNGLRLTNKDLEFFLEKGNKILIGELSDKNGSHGEILVLTIDSFGNIFNFVMSCRVFQRKAEYAFLSIMNRLGFKEVKFEFIPTKRNKPFHNFATKVGVEYKTNKFLLNEESLNDLSKNFEKIIEIDFQNLDLIIPN